MPRLPPVAKPITLDIPTAWLIGLAAGLVAAALWGGGAVVARHLVNHNIAPLDLALLRYAGCFPIALLFAISGRGSLKACLSWWRFTVLLVLAGPPYHLLLLSGYQYAGAGGGTLMICGLLPLFALGLSAGAGRRSLVSGRALTGLLLIGVGLLMLAIKGGATMVMPWGVVIFAGAALAWALLNFLITEWNVDALELTVALGLSAPLFLPLYILARGEIALPAGSFDQIFLQMAYHGVGVAFGATFLFFAAVKRAGAQAAANMQALAPAFATLFGVVLLAEPMTLGTAIAVMGIVAGIALAAPGPATRGLDADQGRPHVQTP